MSDSHSYRRIAALAFPIILANCTAPLLALTDTAVIGHFGSVTDLGAIALGGLLFNFIFWGFGFLRMSTSGFVAQAWGRRDDTEMVATVARGLLVAFSFGALLLLLQRPILNFALWCFGGSEPIETTTRTFFFARIWGAPACLGLYVLTGFLIGRGHSRELLVMQLMLNGLNIALDILLAGVFKFGVRGIGIGTALAEWLTLLIAGVMVWRMLNVRAVPALRQAIFDRTQLRRMFASNIDILIRTLTLLFGFALFADRGARFGDITLAANHVLLQLISFSAFFLDGFAFATEALVGRALGAEDRDEFRLLMKRSTVLAAITAAALALILLGSGGFIIHQLTNLPDVRIAAINFLPYAAAYVFCSFAAFQLDGIFIGAARTKAMRDTALISTAVFALAAFTLASAFGNVGLWWAFIVFVVVRAAALMGVYGREYRRGYL